MMKFKKLAEPAGFAAAVKASKDAIAAEVANQQKPNFKNRNDWRDFKADMAPATFGKCGYCEVDVWAVDRFKGDVEHFRPKGKVNGLTIEADGSTKVSQEFDGGYHWLAYEWDNYILSCGPCNSANKGNFFPLDPPAQAAPAVGAEKTETPLLLSPFSRKDPTKHLVFDVLGVVGPRKSSKFGKNTIAVCGLNRNRLMKKRKKVAKIVQIHLDVFGDGSTTGPHVQLALTTIAQMGAADMEHAGMVRSMFSEATELAWSFVEQAVPLPEPVFEA